ncbi:HNH endonuclease signature motif containing protein [Intrasporangium calvum]|uniref:HNH endonuclease signature motif containing protein n=1 Tax=Intrasporangium calvum TaxID=53358 RepID=UPI001F1D87DB|nr:HNH endonuclease signature motif containing protein [Intrasporangium calvum]
MRHHTEQVRPPKDEGDEERVDAGRRSARGLWFGQPNRTGMVSLRGVLDPEAAAVLKSAIAPLAAPCPERDGHGHTVSPDPRSPAKRRADALVEIVERGVAAAADLPVTDKAKLVVTLDHEVLTGRIRGTGLAGSGDVITAAAVRRLACDAAIIPMVLGGAGEPLDVGRARRLVTAAMRAALWQRDAGCTFPGCTAPAQWTDAHHVTPWWGGGPTSMDNLALLCRRHHTHVHRHELTATVRPTGVTWHT